ncbi:MAG: hypothetical protein GYA51_06760 [Candidatus Methanofastidiosa archaeon]|jgi:hypothetical protein|nr:hypothetical protein [Candidatus Methanofastidiosa archaeon]
MQIKAVQIIGSIVAIIGFALMLSSIFGYKLEFIPLENGIFSLGLVIIVIGIIIAAKIPSDEDY